MGSKRLTRKYIEGRQERKKKRNSETRLAVEMKYETG